MALSEKEIDDLQLMMDLGAKLQMKIGTGAFMGQPLPACCFAILMLMEGVRSASPDQWEMCELIFKGFKEHSGELDG